MSPEQLPVAVPELEQQSPVQHPSETSPRNTPIRAERRYPARERKAPDRLNLDFKNILRLRTLSTLSRSFDITKFKFVIAMYFWGCSAFVTHI